MTLRERLIAASAPRHNDVLVRRFGVLENPFPASSQTADNPHYPHDVDEEINTRIETFIRDKTSQVIVIVGTQGTGKTNILNYYEGELKQSIPALGGFYVVRYLADPEASFDGTIRRLFQELGLDHLVKVGEKLSHGQVEKIDLARSHEFRTALHRLARSRDKEATAESMSEWLLGLRLLKSHKEQLGVQFRLDTVESRTIVLRDLVVVSSALGILNGIFLLLDELEKQDGVLGPTAVVRYLSSMRAIIDALPRHLFMMIAVTPDALLRYSSALPAFRSRLENRFTLQPLTDFDDAVALADCSEK